LWVVATVGSWFHFLTLMWIVIVVSHTLPVIYEQYKDVIDHYVKVAGDEVHKQYKTIHAAVLSKIPRAPVVKEKKVM
jgi:diacylglycerol kinase